MEYNRFEVSDTISIEKPAGGYMKWTEYRNSARGYLIAQDNNGAMECYLEEMIQGTTMKHQAYEKLVFSAVESSSTTSL